MNIRALSLAGVAAILFAAPALAHHSFAMFDPDQSLTMEGNVTEFEWINPHVWLHAMIEDEDGQEYQWLFEMGSVGQLIRAGWTRETIKEGDTVTITFHPLRDGSRGGQLRAMELAGGRVMRQGAGAVSDPP